MILEYFVLSTFVTDVRNPIPLSAYLGTIPVIPFIVISEYNLKYLDKFWLRGFPKGLIQAVDLSLYALVRDCVRFDCK